MKAFDQITDEQFLAAVESSLFPKADGIGLKAKSEGLDVATAQLSYSLGYKVLRDHVHSAVSGFCQHDAKRIAAELRVAIQKYLETAREEEKPRASFGESGTR